MPKLTKPPIAQLFRQLEEQVYRYWPTAKYIPSNAAHISVFDYANSLIKTNPVDATRERREQFRTFFKEKTTGLFGKIVGESVYQQLATNHAISTVHHFTPLSPKALNPTLAISLGYFDRKEIDRQNIIVLACGGISFNNHWYPRGYQFHSLMGETMFEDQLNFVPRSADSYPVISAPAYTESLKQVFSKQLFHYRSEKRIKKQEVEVLTNLFDKILFTPQILSQNRFIDQVSLTNYFLWQKIFTSYSSNIPRLIFLSQEDVAADLLRRFHIHQKTILYHILFNTDWHALIYKYFNNIKCAFSLEQKYGTFLFWAIPKNTTKRIQLFAKNGVLESPDGEIRMRLKPEIIQQALENNEITPSTMLTFLVLGMYYGFFLTGGVDQPTYLTQIKHAYIQMLTELGLNEEVENSLPILTGEIIYPRPTIAFVDSLDNQRFPAGILDLLLHGTPDSWSTVKAALKKVTMEELLFRMYPDLYRHYTDIPSKNPTLLAVTEQNIEQYKGLLTKIPPWALLTNG